MIIGSAESATTYDPTSKAAASQAKLEDELNRFLNLLVTQLKNQDPLDPMDANEFTSQLVQFASVEQQIQQNGNLEKMLNLQESTQIGTMVDFIGKIVEAPGKTFNLENGVAAFSYTLAEDADQLNINIKDSSGRTVFYGTADATAGRHQIAWDGVDSNGYQLADGTYTVTVAALDRAGSLLDVEQTVFGRVTGTGVEDGEVSLFMGSIPVSLEDILAVREALGNGGTGSDEQASAGTGDDTSSGAGDQTGDDTQTQT